jgi:ABC-type multidrug transport system permease subunit
VFLREYAGRMYGVFSYFMSKSLLEVPFQTIMPILFSLIVYFGVGLEIAAEEYFIFLAVLILDVF